ncbi:MAG: amino acid adenylation domain-containing protein [Propionibacteriaceae bacterium]|nr:amino acid adenylation domain-containing protein [Propionibacteriaceae bacterium]
MRVELGEIAAAVREAPGVKDAAVVIRRDAAGEPAVHAYYVPVAGPAGAAVTPETVRSALAGRLPWSMAPTAIMPIDAIPTTAAGKLNRAALPVPAAADAVEAPGDDAERQVAEVFAAVLGLAVDKIGRHSDFFALGGHSLRATRAVNLLEARAGVRLRLAEFFAAATVAAVAALLKAADSASGYRPIEAVGGPGRYPASPAQSRLWALDHVDDVGLAYNLPLCVELTGPVDEARLAWAFTELVDRHEALRTSFAVDDGGPVQIVAAHAPAVLECVHVPDLGPAARDRLAEDFVRPFDLTRPPLMRLRLVRALTPAADGPDALLMADFHHIVADGTTLGVLVGEFCALYNGEALAPLGPQYKDYTAWAAAQDVSAQRDYWLERFAEPPAPLDLPTDFPRPAAQTFVGAVERAEIGADVGVAAFARRLGVTEFDILAAGVMAVLARYGRTEDLAVGVPISGRLHQDAEAMAGMFVGTLALRAAPRRATTVRDFAAAVHQAALAAHENQAYPFEALVDQVAAERDMSRNPLFDVMVALQNTEPLTARLRGLAARVVPLAHRVSRFDLSLSITPSPDGSYAVDAEYSTDLFRPETIRTLLHHLDTWLRAALARPDATLGELPMADEAERRRLTVDWNQTAVDLATLPTARPGAATFVDLFGAAVAAAPGKVAVECDGDEITYADLDRLSDQLAQTLAGLGAGRGARVALGLARGVQQVAAVLAVAKAGAAWVPLDPTYPLARRDAILADAAAVALVVDADDPSPAPAGLTVLRLAPRGAGGAAEAVVAAVEPAGGAAAAGTPAGLAPAAARPDDPAYVIYTSGTTGQPKGVVVDHAGLANQALVVWRDIGVSSDDHVLGYSNPVFDASVWECVMTLGLGGTLHVVPPERMLDAAWLNRAIAERCTVAVLTPPVAASLEVAPLRLLVEVGSEAVALPGFGGVFANGYGPAEISICATAWRRPDGMTGFPKAIPIGRPVSNCLVYVVDEDLRLTGCGVPGELLIGGVGVGPGYLGSPAATAAAFLPNPFGPGRVYRSGDLARWTPDGDLVFMGRIDTQVKIRGQRLELGEVATAIRETPGVADAAAVVQPGPSGDAIVAYVVFDRPAADSRIQAVAEALRGRLPGWMLPAAIVPLAALPTNRSGKLDVAQLPKAEFGVGRAAYAPASGAAEQALAAAVAEILGVAQVGAEDSFFELGGDSIAAIRLVSALRRRGWELGVRDLLTFGTVGACARVARPTAAAAVQAPLTGPVALAPIQRRFFAAQHLDPGHFGQAVFLRGHGFDAGVLRAALAAVAVHHDMLRAVYPPADDGTAGAGLIREATADPAELARFDVVRLEPGAPVDLAAVEARNTALQAGFALATGPLLAAVLYQGAADDHLLVCAHHLVVDAVSWRVLLGDLSVAYQQLEVGQAVALEPKTAAYADWLAALADYGLSSRAKRQIPYWTETARRAAAHPLRLPPPGDPSNPVSVTARATVDAETTAQLLGRANSAYSTQPLDLLLAAVAWAARALTGQEVVAVDHETHGRHDIGAGLATDRTVGWFTSLHPVVLEAGGSVGDAIVAVKEALRTAPDHGMAYHLLVDAGEVPAVVPNLAVNWLGDTETGFDAFGGGAGAVAGRSPWPAGDAISPRNCFDAAVSVNAGVAGGEAFLWVTCDTSRTPDGWGDAFAHAVASALAEVVGHCAGRDEATRTASDFSGADLSAPEVGEILGLFG